MYCHNCGKQIIEGGKFCSSCGTQVAEVAEGAVNPDPEEADTESGIDMNKLGKDIAINTAKIGLKTAVAPVTVPVKMMKWGLGIRDKKCPRCDSKNINKVKPSARSMLMRPIWLQPKTLFVCRDCGFDWKDM